MEASISFRENPEVQSIEKKATDIQGQAAAIMVTSHEQEQAAVDFLKGLKAVRKEVEGTFGPIKEKAHAAWKETVAQEKKHLEPLDAAERMVKGKIVYFQDEQEKLRRLEQARLEEQARKEQQKRIDAAMKRVNGLLEKSTDINGQISALEAELAGYLSEDERATIEHSLNMLRVKRDNLNQAVLDKTAEVERAQYVAPVPVVAVPAPKTQGASSRVKKKAVIQNAMQLIKAVAAGQAPVEAISFNMAVLDKLVNAGAIVPGVGFTEDRILSVR